jgi:two-component system phosphate regulon sensor histidine kinase PhoR
VPDIDGLVQALRQMHRQMDERFGALRAEQAASAALVEAMMEGVIAADGRGRITTANEAARRLLGYEAGVALPDLPTLFRAKAAAEVVNAVREGRPVQDRQLEVDGRTLLVNARPLGEDGAVLVLHDLTELRRLENVRRDFVANVSHELKTPLTSISGYAETLLADAPDAATSQHFPPDHRQQRAPHAAAGRRSCWTSRASSRDAGSRGPEAVEVATTAREVISSLADRAIARGVTLDVQVPDDTPVVFADPDALRQILTNLVDNSIRYAPRGMVTCSARALDGGVEVAVSDDGAWYRERAPAAHLRAILPRRSIALARGGRHGTRPRHREAPHRGARRRVSAESSIGQGTTISCWFPNPGAD